MVGKLQNFKHDIRMFWLSWLIQFKAATKLRAAFALQVVGMMINNVGLLVAWWFLFDRFDTINGWSGVDLIGMQGISMLAFGVIVLFFYGVTELPRHVDQGSFDAFLTKPVGVLPQLASSLIEISALGDLILGALLVTWYLIVSHVSLAALLLFVPAVIIGAILLWCFVLLPYILAFYVFDSEKVSRNISFLFLDVSLYPSGILSGPLRTVLLTVFPGLFVAAMPIELLKGVSPWYLVGGFLVAIIWLFITLKLFRHAIRRYESANLIGAR